MSDVSALERCLAQTSSHESYDLPEDEMSMLGSSSMHFCSDRGFDEEIAVFAHCEPEDIFARNSIRRV